MTAPTDSYIANLIGSPVGETRLSDRFLNSQDRALRQEAQNILATNSQFSIPTGAIISNARTHNIITNHDIYEEHFAASINKVPASVVVLDKLRAGTLKLSTQVTWEASDIRGGAGDFDQPNAPTTGTVQELLRDMLHNSGNTAMRVTVNYLLGGAEAVNETWKNQYGLEHTYLVPLGNGLFYFGYTNTSEALTSLKRLALGKDRYSKLVKEYLSTNIWDEMGVRSVLNNSENILLINKIGYLDDPDGNNRHDIGFVVNTKTGKAYSYAFLQTAPTSAEATAQANKALRDFGIAIIKQAGGNPAYPVATQDANSARLFSTTENEKQPEQGRIAY